MKKQIFSLIGAVSLASCLSAADLLTGDTRLSCEAILCLSSGTRPSECQPSISRYFSIKERFWSDTVAKRKSFLQLCPVGEAGESDQTFRNLRDQVLIGLTCDCSLKCLNRVETKRVNCIANERGSGSDCDYLYRINPVVPEGCKALINHGYTNLEYEYKCSGEWYSQLDWNRGYALKEISKEDYNRYASPRRGSVKKDVEVYYSRGDYYNYVTKYYKKVAIEKNCWVDK